MSDKREPDVSTPPKSFSHEKLYLYISNRVDCRQLKTEVSKIQK